MTPHQTLALHFALDSLLSDPRSIVQWIDTTGDFSIETTADLLKKRIDQVRLLESTNTSDLYAH